MLTVLPLMKIKSLKVKPPENADTEPVSQAQTHRSGLNWVKRADKKLNKQIKREQAKPMQG